MLCMLSAARQEMPAGSRTGDAGGGPVGSAAKGVLPMRPSLWAPRRVLSEVVHPPAAGWRRRARSPTAASSTAAIRCWQRRLGRPPWWMWWAGWSAKEAARFAGLPSAPRVELSSAFWVAERPVGAVPVVSDCDYVRAGVAALALAVPAGWRREPPKADDAGVGYPRTAAPCRPTNSRRRTWVASGSACAA